MIKVAFKIRDKDGNTYKKPRLRAYTSHNLQGNLSGFHFLTFNMNEFNVGDIFISKGRF